MKRKSRRRSQWGKGIIKKRKVNNLKKDDDDAKFADDENHGEDSKLLENGELEMSTDCIEENGEETGDLSMTNDESSCDIMDIDAEQRLNNGTSGKDNNFASTEEESNEKTLQSTDIETKDAEADKEGIASFQCSCPYLSVQVNVYIFNCNILCYNYDYMIMFYGLLSIYMKLLVYLQRLIPHR